MKRLLLITYYYPPRPGVGSIRPGGLAKYLPEFGWEPIIMTPALPPGPQPNARVIETGYRDVLADLKARVGLNPQKGVHEQLKLPQSSTPRWTLPHTTVLSWLKEAIVFPDPFKGWLPFARQSIRQFAARETVDAILTTSHPVTCHLLGAFAKRELRRPWLADCRDLWVGPATPRAGILTGLNRALERRTLSQADALVTVSAPLADHLQHRHPTQPVTWITNGFDPDDFRSPNGDLTPFFSITYTGTLYEGKRDPTLLFEALAELSAEGRIDKKLLRLRFYGPQEPWLFALARRYGLEEALEAHGMVPRIEALRVQRESQLLLLLGMNNAADPGCYTGKIFEYLASGRPTIALGGENGVVSQLLRESDAGVCASSKPQLCDFLMNAYAEFRASGHVEFHGREQVINQYTHREMARKFASELDHVAGASVDVQSADCSTAADTDSDRPQVDLGHVA